MKNDQEMRKMRTDFIQNHATEVLQLRQQHALELKQQVCSFSCPFLSVD